MLRIGSINAITRYSLVHLKLRTPLVDGTARQQEIASRRYLFANTSAEQEDEIYPVTIKEVAEAQWAHRHYTKYFKDTNETFKDKDSRISIRTISDE